MLFLRKYNLRYNGERKSQNTKKKRSIIEYKHKQYYLFALFPFHPYNPVVIIKLDSKLKRMKKSKRIK